MFEFKLQGHIEKRYIHENLSHVEATLTPFPEVRMLYFVGHSHYSWSLSLAEAPV